MSDDLDQQQPTDPMNDDEVHITDLDYPGSPRTRWVEQTINLARRGLARPWVRSSLYAVLLMILLGALLLQIPRPMTPQVSSGPKTSAPPFLSATTLPGLIFIQSTDHTLTAYQSTTGHVRWNVYLPASSTIIAKNHSLYCYFRTGTGDTELEALDANTGSHLWNDTLPAVFALGRTGQFENVLGNISLGPAFVYYNNALYIQTSNDTIYAIQASTGRTNWTYRTHDNPAQQLSPTLLYTISLDVEDGVLDFSSTNSIFHFLDANTGREMLSLPAKDASSYPVIDGQMIYILSSSSRATSPISAFHVPDGRLLWTRQFPEGTAVQIEMNGMIYLSLATDPTLIALSGSNGQQLWTYHFSDDQPASRMFFAENGFGYLLQQDATLVKISTSDGQALWSTQIATLQSQNFLPLGFIMDQGNLVLYTQNSLNSSIIPMYILRASDGQLLWSSLETITSAIPFNGTIYALQNNGEFDAWREDNGQRLWNNTTPLGSIIAGFPTTDVPLIFLIDLTGNFSVWRPNDGKLLWHYP